MKWKKNSEFPLNYRGYRCKLCTPRVDNINAFLIYFDPSVDVPIVDSKTWKYYNLIPTPPCYNDIGPYIKDNRIPITNNTTFKFVYEEYDRDNYRDLKSQIERLGLK